MEPDYEKLIKDANDTQRYIALKELTKSISRNLRQELVLQFTSYFFCLATTYSGAKMMAEVKDGNYAGPLLYCLIPAGNLFMARTLAKHRGKLKEMLANVNNDIKSIEEGLESKVEE